MGSGTFLAIAQVTSQPQILNVRPSACGDWDDMFNMQPLGGKASSRQTIATAIKGFFFDLLSNMVGNMGALRGHVKLLNR